MDINNKKLLFALSAIALVVIIIQLNAAFGSNSNLEVTDNSMVEDTKNNNALDNNMENIKQDKTNSMNINNNNNRLTAGSDITVYEGEPITLKPIIPNAIALPENSLLYSWNQIEGPKINLTEQDKKNKILKFTAPNYPTDTRYAFEVKVLQKKPNGNIDFGKDTINVLVIDANKIAKGSGMNIPLTSSSSLPSTSTSPSSSSSQSPQSKNIPNNNNNNNGEIVVQGGGQFNPNFRDDIPDIPEREKKKEK